MRGIEDMWFYTEQNRVGKFVGRVREFPDVRTRPYEKRVDAISEVVTLTSQRIREIHESQWKAAGQ